mmetsp:Transcript_23683/g.51707  ORF Transcript_23683/g.51707 Transcript_23683/m.51707 type:complete len:275 (-) Transcript_23683:19-843(-)
MPSAVLRSSSVRGSAKVGPWSYRAYRSRVVAAAKSTQDHRPCVVLSNDDGCDFPLLTSLYHELRRSLPRELEVVICAPATNQSAASHRITLGKKMRVTERRDVGKHVFSVEGSPADSMQVAIGSRCSVVPTLGLTPILAVSGINLGPNLSTDVLYSGTVAAAREAGFNGVPAISASLATRELTEASCQGAVTATCRLVEAAVRLLGTDPPANYPRRFEGLLGNGQRNSRSIVELSEERDGVTSMDHPKALRDAFRSGDVMLNLNVPPGWAEPAD